MADEEPDNDAPLADEQPAGEPAASSEGSEPQAAAASEQEEAQGSEEPEVEPAGEEAPGEQAPESAAGDGAADAAGQATDEPPAEEDAGAEDAAAEALAAGDEDAAGESGEAGAEAPAGEEGGHLRTRPGDRLDDLRGHTARRGKERRRRDCPVIPCFGDLPEPRYGVLLDDGQALHDDGEKLLEVVGDDRRGSSGKERHAGFPDAPAFGCVPAERRQTPGGPARPRRDDLAVRRERLAERGAPPQKIGPLLAKIQSRERAPQAWIDISTT